MAHQRRYLPFLLGIGVRWLSVEPIYLSAVQAEIARIDLAAATVDEVTDLLPVEEYATHSWVEVP